MNKIFINLMVCKLLLLATLTCYAKSAIFTTEPANRLYVAEGATGDGSGWDNALGDLSNALNMALANPVITEIWVKAGTYKPSGQPYNLSLGNLRHNAFYLIKGVTVLGGFAGNETDTYQRTPGNQSILSGDIGLPGDADNCYHTIVAVDSPGAYLGGFVIRDGNADGTGVGADILGTTVDASSGGGLALYSPGMVTSCTFTTNKAGKGGAIFLNVNAAGTRINQCLIADNTATEGGGIYNAGSTTGTIQICTIGRNTSAGQGAGVFNLQSSWEIISTIIWGNNGQSPAGIADPVAKLMVTASLVQGGVNGDGNLNSDPFFADQSDPNGPDDLWMTADDGLRPLPCSPVVNRGHSVNFKPAFDITGRPRDFDAAMDMGAYELQTLRDGTSLALDGDQAYMGIPGGRLASLSSQSFLADGCRIIARVTTVKIPGQQDNVLAKVKVAGSVIAFDGFHFVQRYYEMRSSMIPQVLDVTVTLFFTQSEFDAFNAVGGDLKLPTSPSDATGKANLLVIDYRNFNADLPPGGGNGHNLRTIDPDDNKIVWNANLNRWEVSFNSDLYSGFFVTNGQSFPLKLLSFTAEKIERTTSLEWLTAEEVNTSHFELHRSANARDWQALPVKLAAMGGGGHRYTTYDNEPTAGLNYYRLKMIDLDGSFTFSKIVTTEHGNAFKAQAFPNPATTWMKLELTGAGVISGKAELVNTGGTVVWKGRIVDGKATLEVSNIPRGLYLLRVQSGGRENTQKVAIQ
jgi:hypothetical protein